MGGQWVYEQELAEARAEIARLQSALRACEEEMERVVETVTWEDVERVLGLEGAEVAELDKRAIVDAAAREYGDYIDGSCGDARYDCFSRAVEYVIPGMLESLYC